MVNGRMPRRLNLQFFRPSFPVSIHKGKEQKLPWLLPPACLTRILAMKSHVRRTLASAGLLVAGLTLALAAHAKFVAAGDVEVKFQAKGPAGLKIDGEGTSLDAREEDGNVIFTASLENLKTGIGKRDEHLKEALGVNKGHKQARLTVPRSAVKLPEDNKTVEGKTTAKFFLHGKERNVPVEYKVKRTGSDYHVQGRTSINIEEYGIEKPCYLGVCVDPNVRIRVKIKLRDK